MLEVTLRGRRRTRAIGAFVNSEEVQSLALEPMPWSTIDHRNLNTDVDFMRGVIPTSENLARVLFEQLRKGKYGKYLEEVRIHESVNNAAAYRPVD